MAGQDRAYTSLLSHLHNPSSSLPFSAIQAALAHHLANLSPLPTPLAATAVSSPLYLSQPLTQAKIQSLSISFRHAVHLKYRALVDNHERRSILESVFGSNMQSSMGNWINATVKGIQGGHPVLRLACCSGLLLGVEDLKAAEKPSGERLEVGWARGNVEDELALALAEVIDTYAYTYNSEATSAEEWESEFQQGGQAILSLALIMAAQSLPLVDDKRLKALPLPILGRLLLSTISSAFDSGEFLSSMQPSISRNVIYKIDIPASSPLAHRIQVVSTSPIMASIASLSKLTAKVYALLLDAIYTSRVREALKSASFALQTVQDMAKKVELEWSSSSLADANENDISPESRDLTKAIWTILKTLLFSTVMLADAILSACIYVPSPCYLSSFISPSLLALQTLQALSHLSFVISQFGGVTSTAQGFRELKKTFYMALDIVAQGDAGIDDSMAKANLYIRESCTFLKSDTIQRGAQSNRLAKQAYLLACAEQLVSVLNEESLRDWVWDACYPHLFDPSHRETFESAHSVVLTIFASHAQKIQQQQKCEDVATAVDKASRPILSANFVKHLIPFYAQCLVENSVDGGLSSAQLCLAFSALVRSAGATSPDTPPDEPCLMSWYCIEHILDVVRSLSQYNTDAKGKAKATFLDYNTDLSGRLFRLHLMLVASVSSLPLTLMLRLLDEIRGIIILYPLPDNSVPLQDEEKGPKRQVLVEALFEEILEKVGDREKEGAMRWWYQNRATLTGGLEHVKQRTATGEDESGMTLARL
ncbi:hypothetical protein BDQ17DRAFT_1299826 [Cyathus striatus]|nr:hypothetical protein BDQ17DRAFT_1299826 [Cyathus striatus]